MNNLEIINVNEKSFKNYTFSQNDKLGKINVFFGKNGSGKSALAKYFYDRDKLGTKLFDTEYVRNNVLAESGIEGTSIIIGNSQIVTQRKIDENNEAIRKAEGENKKFEDEKSLIQEKANERMEDFIQSQKDGFKVKINQKSGAKVDLRRALEMWSKDLSIPTQSSAKSLQELNAEITIAESKSNIKIECLKRLDQNFFDECNNILGQVVVKPQSALSAKLISWLKQGRDIHNLNGDESQEVKCLFCGSKVNRQELITKIDKEINNEYSQFVKNIEEKIIWIQSAQNESKEIGNHDALTNFLNDWERKLKEKLNIPDSLMHSGNEVQLLNIVHQIKDEINNNRSRLKELNDEKNNLKQIARKNTAEKICNDKVINNYLNSIVSIDNNILKNKEKVQTLIEDNEKLKNQAQNYSSFMNLVNLQLSLCGANFRLEDGDVSGKFNIIVKHDKLSNDQLSEGEIRLLAFLKFYYDLFTQFDQNVEKGTVDDKIRTIIFDDPITSIDYDNRIFIVEMINRFINKCVAPSSNLNLLIFTHSDYDFHNFGYGNTNVHHFLITKDEQDYSMVKTIETKELANYSDTYRDDFANIISFALMKNKPLGINYMKFANQARFVLESNARSNYNLQYATTKEEGPIMNDYQVDSSAKNKHQIRFMLDTINSLSHGFSYFYSDNPGPRIQEVQKAIRILITMMFHKDSMHVISMCRLEQDELSNKINSWQCLDYSK